jgi:pimeloyl-ACP methyl ester carboxylesterase
MILSLHREGSAITTPTTSILLLPGFDGTGELFAPLQLALGGRFSTTVVRYRDEHTLGDYVDSVESLLPAQDAVLVAESFSGPIALAVMARHPKRIRCAVLCATFPVSPFRLLTRLARFVPTSFFGANPAQRAILRTFCFDRKSDPSVVARALSVIRSVPASALKSRLNLLADIDMRAHLSQISVPVLYLQALQDRVVATRLSQQLIDALPNVTVRKLDGPHLLLQSRPHECAEAITSFVALKTLAKAAS